MNLRVLFDTNILVSALIADSPPSRVLEEAIEGRIELLLPDSVLDEFGRVATEKLGFPEERVEAACDLFGRLAAERPAPARRVEAVTGDAADDAVLACAVEAKADVLVTGDRKHLLPLGCHRGVRLLAPQALLAELRSGA